MSLKGHNEHSHSLSLPGLYVPAPSRSWPGLPHLTSEQREDVSSHRNRQTSNFISAPSQSLLNDRNAPQDRDRQTRKRGARVMLQRVQHVGSHLVDGEAWGTITVVSRAPECPFRKEPSSSSIHLLPEDSKAVTYSSPCRSILPGCGLPSIGNPMSIQRWSLQRMLPRAREPGVPGTHRQRLHVSKKSC